MQSLTRLFFVTTATTSLLCGPATAQHEGHQNHSTTHQNQTTTTSRVGDPYPLAKCPVSGKQLGVMGDPAVKLYDGREVRFCCRGCTGKFEKSLAESLARIDERIVADQLPLYPIETSVVTGEKLPEKPIELVYGNRLIRLGSEKERAAFHKAPAKFMRVLNDAVVAAQGKDYVLDDCPVSGEALGSMGESEEVIVAGRLVRVCCVDCLEDVEKAPSKFVAMIDRARAEKSHAHRHGRDEGKAHESSKASGK